MKKRKNLTKKTSHKSIIFIVIAFLTGTLTGLLILNLLPPEKRNSSLILRESGYEFINPLIDFDNVDFIKTKEAKDLEKQLSTYIKEQMEKEASVVDNVSLYYRDLNTGIWVGINEKEGYALASLTKVPVMIAHYKIAEKNPNHLKQEFTYTVDPNLYVSNNPLRIDDNREGENTLKEGETYTLDEFINQLIVYSDNTVLPFLLLDETYVTYLDKVFSDLGLPNPYMTDDENLITVKEYSAFFRVLYNSTYLNKEMSSKALELLSRVSFDDGLAKGLPKDIVLANKFGARKYTTEKGNIEQLHDCGIIYHPRKPYLLCIMTRGSRTTVQTRIISDLSSIVYSIVDKN